MCNKKERNYIANTCMHTGFANYFAPGFLRRSNEMNMHKRKSENLNFKLYIHINKDS